MPEAFPNIDPGATIGENCTISTNCHIEAGAVVGDDCRIEHGALVGADSIIDANTIVGEYAILGKLPYRAAMSVFEENGEPLGGTHIGPECIIGATTIIYRGCTLENNVLAADQATIRERVTVGAYTILGRSACVENDTTVGKHCKLETGCYITAFSQVGDYVFIGPYAVTSNDNFLGRTQERLAAMRGPTINDGARIGANVTILPGIIIGSDSLIAAGSIVTRDVDAGVMVKGVPAKPAGEIPAAQSLENHIAEIDARMSD
jgi:acetyltransferase-like isoleucine patch superfamily enzyme